MAAQSFPISDIYDKSFDPNAYLEAYFTDVTGAKDGWKHFANTLKFWLETFSKGDIIGDDLIELGSGPNLMPAIFASRRFKNIYLSDYAEVNRRAMLAWLKGEADAWNWTPFCKDVARLEGLDDGDNGAKYVEERARSAIRDVYSCNVLLDQSLHPRPLHQYDCLITAGMLEAAAPDHPTYARCVRNIATLLKPGGTVLVVGYLKETFYMVGGKRFFALDTDENFVRVCFREAGFDHIEMKVFEESSSSNLFDAEGYFYLKAQKRS